MRRNGTTADLTRFYFDGTLVRTQDNLYWQEPKYLFPDSEDPWVPDRGRGSDED